MPGASWASPAASSRPLADNTRASAEPASAFCLHRGFLAHVGYSCACLGGPRGCPLLTSATAARSSQARRAAPRPRGQPRCVPQAAGPAAPSPSLHAVPARLAERSLLIRRMTNFHHCFHPSSAAGCNGWCPAESQPRCCETQRHLSG